MTARRCDNDADGRMQLSVGAAVNAAAAVKAGRDPALAMEMAAWRQHMEAERKKYFEAASAERSEAISRAISDQISQVHASDSRLGRPLLDRRHTRHSSKRDAAHCERLCWFDVYSTAIAADHTFEPTASRWQGEGPGLKAALQKELSHGGRR
jgi:hypothetical protein